MLLTSTSVSRVIKTITISVGHYGGVLSRKISGSPTATSVRKAIYIWQ